MAVAETGTDQQSVRPVRRRTAIALVLLAAAAAVTVGSLVLGGTPDPGPGHAATAPSAALANPDGTDPSQGPAHPDGAIPGVDAPTLVQRLAADAGARLERFPDRYTGSGRRGTDGVDLHISVLLANNAAGKVYELQCTYVHPQIAPTPALLTEVGTCLDAVVPGADRSRMAAWLAADGAHMAVGGSGYTDLGALRLTVTRRTAAFIAAITPAAAR